MATKNMHFVANSHLWNDVQRLSTIGQRFLYQSAWVTVQNGTAIEWASTVEELLLALDCQSPAHQILCEVISSQVIY